MAEFALLILVNVFTRYNIIKKIVSVCERYSVLINHELTIATWQVKNIHIRDQIFTGLAVMHGEESIVNH